MNAYFDDFTLKISDNRIIEGTFEELLPRKSLGERLHSAVAAVVRVATRVVGSRLFAPATLAVTLLGFALIVGAVERGTLRLFPALLLGLSLAALEGMTLRRFVKRAD